MVSCRLPHVVPIAPPGHFSLLLHHAFPRCLRSSSSSSIWSQCQCNVAVVEAVLSEDVSNEFAPTTNDIPPLRAGPPTHPREKHNLLRIGLPIANQTLSVIGLNQPHLPSSDVFQREMTGYSQTLTEGVSLMPLLQRRSPFILTNLIIVSITRPVRAATWNVLTLSSPGYSTQLYAELTPLPANGWAPSYIPPWYCFDAWRHDCYVGSRQTVEWPWMGLEQILGPYTFNQTNDNDRRMPDLCAKSLVAAHHQKRPTDEYARRMAPSVACTKFGETARSAQRQKFESSTLAFYLRAILTWASEACTPSAAQLQRIDAYHRKCLRNLLGIR